MAGTQSRSRSARPSDPAPTNPNLNAADAFAAHFAPQPAQEATVLPPETPINSNDDPEPATTTTATAAVANQPSVNVDVNREEEEVSRRILHLHQNVFFIIASRRALRGFSVSEAYNISFIAIYQRDSG